MMLLKPLASILGKASLLIALFISMSCGTKESTVLVQHWGQADGKEVRLYTLQNENGMVVQLTNYGGIITSVLVPDRQGNFADVVLGFDNLEQYLQPNPCFGATIGRFANRIRNARFTIDGINYQLTQNDSVHCIHGAGEFNTAVWEADLLKNGVRFYHFSKDGTNGFPGNLKSYVTYELTDSNEIKVTFEAETDKATHVNMTQHSYFNLNACESKIYDHIVWIDADSILAIDSMIIPIGPMQNVVGTEADLTTPTSIGANIHKMNYNGYHYCYAFNHYDGSLREVIKIQEPKSGRTLDVLTTQPGVQFYTGNAIAEGFKGKEGRVYGMHSAFCLETQHFPNSPNLPNFPSTLLRPGEKYKEVVIYRFGINK